MAILGEVSRDQPCVISKDMSEILMQVINFEYIDNFENVDDAFLKNDDDKHFVNNKSKILVFPMRCIF